MNLTEVKRNAKQSVSVAPPKLKIQAVLCWSEFYNGQWRAAKTSNIARPADLGIYPINSFDRAQLWLAVGETAEHLRVEIQYGFNLGGKAWFHLFNTHSAPVSGGDDASIKSIPFFSFKWFSNSPFTVNYWDAFANKVLTRNVLKDTMAGTQHMAPRHIHPNSWDAPFFFSDSRNAFYVTAIQAPVWISDYPRYGYLLDYVSKYAAAIPALVTKNESKIQIGPIKWGDGGPLAHRVEIVNPGPIERFVSEDANIRQGIAASAVVSYGDRQIGPSGVIPTFNLAK